MSEVREYPQAVPAKEYPNFRRREAIKKAGLAVLAFALSASKAEKWVSKLDQLGSIIGNVFPDQYQLQAAQEFKVDPYKLHNLKIGKNGAILRSRPSSLSEKAFEDKNLSLAPETPIETARVVVGNDPNHPADKNRHANWLCIPIPLRDKQVVYVYTYAENVEDYRQQYEDVKAAKLNS